MLFTADEERGSGTSRALVETEARRSKTVCVLEPSLPGGAVKTRRKGIGEFELCVSGISAHAGVDPEKGASAISELATQILKLEALRDVDRGVLVNVGVVEGGDRPNVIAEQARAVIDVRVETAADARRVRDAIYAIQPKRPGTSLRVSGDFSRPPLERSEAVVHLYEVARAVAEELGHDLGEGSTGGGSDGNLTAALGVPTLDGLGAIGDGAHALHEHIDVDHLPWACRARCGFDTPTRTGLGSIGRTRDGKHVQDPAVRQESGPAPPATGWLHKPAGPVTERVAVTSIKRWSGGPNHASPVVDEVAKCVREAGSVAASRSRRGSARGFPSSNVLSRGLARSGSIRI